VDFYFRQGLAASTQRTYTSAKNRYLEFCQRAGLAPLPASEDQFCRFVSFVADQGLAHKTIKCYLSAVRHLHIASRLPDPNISSMSRLEQVLRGIKSQHAKKGRQPRQRLPITPDILLILRTVWNAEPGSRDCIMLWAAVCRCFFGFLRAGEITVPSDSSYDPGAHVNVDDVAVDSKTRPQIMRVRIKASKTDPFRQGVDVFVGRTGNLLCPIAAVLAYLAVRGSGSGPLFRFADGRFLTRDRFVAKVREALTEGGVDCARYAGHSFRIGAATTAARQGVSDATIKMLGRWQSSAYQLYIRTPRKQLAGVSLALVRNM